MGTCIEKSSTYLQTIANGYLGKQHQDGNVYI